MITETLIKNYLTYPAIKFFRIIEEQMWLDGTLPRVVQHAPDQLLHFMTIWLGLSTDY